MAALDPDQSVDVGFVAIHAVDGFNGHYDAVEFGFISLQQCLKLCKVVVGEAAEWSVYGKTG